MSFSRNKIRTHNSGLVREVFSWSLEDIFNEELYTHKVEKIPKSFQSSDEYLNSYIYPLLEETRSELCSSMEIISKAPYAEIISARRTKPPEYYFYEVEVSSWINRSVSRGKDTHKPQPGDVYVLSDAVPETSTDLERVGRTWSFALVTYVPEVELKEKKNDSSSSSSANVNLKHFILKSKNALVLEDGMRDSLFLVFLTNITTNNRIWVSLHKLGDMRILDEVLCPTMVEGPCHVCPSANIDDFQDERLNKCLSSLNDSQSDTVCSCISSMQCNHKPTLKLVWGPPGTGKTKTVSTLLCSLLRMNYRTLACAPTNVAITELSTRVLKMFKESYERDSGISSLHFPLGNILLFGNKDRLKVEGDLEEIYLDNRLNSLEEFLLRNHWRYCFTDLVDFLEECVSEYEIYRENESKNNSKMAKSAKCSDHSFLRFIRKRFLLVTEKVKRCVSVLCTHLCMDYLARENYQQMSNLLGLLDSFECLLSQDDMDEKKLMELFRQSDTDKLSVDPFHPETIYESSALLYKARSEILTVLRSLCKSLGVLNLLNCVDPVETRDQIRELCFQSASLILCTAASSFQLYSVERLSLDLVVVDEAAQLKECESTIPLQLSGLQHVVLVGDEFQLPAMVKSKVCDKAGFGISLFERLSSLGYPKHLLNMQYRMHPDISCFPNSKFYLSQILDATSVKSKSYVKSYLPGRMFGSYSFIDISDGKEEFDDVGHSMKNMVEVAVILTIVRRLFKAWENSREDVSIGIISPYAAQVAAIQERLARKYKGFEGFVVNVKSVDGFQGGEEDIIIMSTVRSNSGGAIGFLSSTQRTNVALTRAKHCLWILGNGTTLTNSESVWRELVNNAKDRKCFFQADEEKDLGKTILQVKKELEELEDLLNPNSILFKGGRWKVLFSDNFKNSFGKLKSSQLQKSVLNLLLKLSTGWRPRKWNVDCICENSSQIVKQFKVLGFYVILSIDIVKHSIYSQVLKIWDILPLEEIENLVKRLDNIFKMYTDDFIDRCKMKCTEGNLEFPVNWEASANIVRYKNLRNNDSLSSLGPTLGTSGGRGYVENSKVSESLLLMKFYSLSSGVVEQLLSGCDGSELDLPFEVTEQELDLILYPKSTFILGRSGTGKTTVLTMKLIRKEQHFSHALEGFHDVNREFAADFLSRSNESRAGNNGILLRQLFVTVSPKLCAAIKNHIDSMMRFTRGSGLRENNALAMHDIDDTTKFEDMSDSFIDVTPKAYPLVLTFQKFLMMLDSSMENSYFDRFQDVRELSSGRSGKSSSVALQVFVRTKEVSFDRFYSSYWPHFNINLTKRLDAITVFTEIISYIKGGLRSAKTFDGKLKREEYVALSEGRVSNLSREKREKIYDIFLNYEKKKVQNGHFDLADFVNDLHRRLVLGYYNGEMMDFVYIDEVQDLSMRQLSLFKYMCGNIEEGFVFSGDTAQTIARGIDFRFQDVKSLFYEEFLPRSTDVVKDKICGKDQLRVSNIFQLSQNFRTHAGVLNLSQSVIDLLYHYFPFSVDVLKPETSLIYGEAPILLESGNEENAIVTIFGNREFSGGNMVGFGAEQVILVRDDCARKEIFDFVGKQALVLTILECKGLEFQDVLLYNFLGTSPLKNHWRVVYQYMNAHNILDTMEVGSFPNFDEAKHKILCSELKQLYVAITRTRQRLWICENTEDLSRPMFDYWKKLSLVQTRKLDESLGQAMQVASSKEEWSSRGTKLFNEGNFEMATMCFERAGDLHREKWSRAAGLRASSERLRGSNARHADIALKQAAEIYEEIHKFEIAAKCFIELKDYRRAGTIYLEKCGESRLEDAGDCFSLACSWSRAADIYSKGNQFLKCLTACSKGKLFEKGMCFIRQWKQSAHGWGGLIFTSKYRERMEQEFLQKGALHYHEQKDLKHMMIFVREFQSMDTIRNFLRSKNHLDDLLLLEEEYGNFVEAAKIAREKGDLPKQADLLAKGGQYEDAGEIFSSSGCWPRAAEVFEKGNYLSKCLLACKMGGLFDKGVDYIEQWKGDCDMIDRRQELEEMEEAFLNSCALHFHERKNTKCMMKFVRKFLSMELIRIFLKSRGYLDELVLLEEEAGNFLEASDIAAEKGDLLLEADMLAKLESFEKASRLIISYVFQHSLWACGSKGWPLKSFSNKEDLLAKAKKFAKHDSESIYELVCLDAALLSEEGNGFMGLQKFLSASERLGSLQAEILSVWKILASHLELQARAFEWEDEVVFDTKKNAEGLISSNRVSIQSLIYFWEFWRSEMESIIDYVQHVGTEDEKDHIVYEQFCLDFLGVKVKDSNIYTLGLWLQADIYWLKNINKTSLLRKGDLVFLDARTFSACARSYWTYQITIGGMKVLGSLDALYKLSVRNSLSIFSQVSALLYMYQVAKYLVDVNKSISSSPESQKLLKYLEACRNSFVELMFSLNWRQTMTRTMVSLKQTKSFESLVGDALMEVVDLKNRVTHGKIGWAVMLLFVSVKLTEHQYEKIATFFSEMPPWKSFIVQFKEHLFQTDGYLSLAYQLKQSLEYTFCSNWRDEVDYMSPHCFIYLVERLMFLVSCCQTSFFTTKSCLIESLSFANLENMSCDSFVCGAVEECHAFIAHTAGQLLFSMTDTLDWLQQSKVDAKQYYPYLVQRLIILISLLCLNSGCYFDFLSNLLGRNEIISQLPPVFCEKLLQWTGPHFGNVIAEALDSVEDSLVILRMDENFPGFVCSKALVINLDLAQSREGLLGVLFPEQSDSVQVQEETMSCSDAAGNLQLSETYSKFWNVVEALSSSTEINALNVLEVEACISVLDAATVSHDEDGSISLEAKCILDELKQLRISLNASGDELGCLKQVFDKLQANRKRLQPWFDSLFLASDVSTCDSKEVPESLKPCSTKEAQVQSNAGNGKKKKKRKGNRKNNN